MESVYLIVALGAIVAGFVQGLSGFAFGLVAMSFWAWTLDPRLAATLSVFGALVGQVLAAFTVRRGFELQRLLPFVLGGLAGIPLGVAVLPHLDMDWFKALLGGLLVIWCPAMLMARALPRVTAGGRIADAAVGMAGGVLGGIGGFTGTLPTLWCTLRGMDKDAQRAIVQNFNLSMLLVTMGIYLATGVVTRQVRPCSRSSHRRCCCPPCSAQSCTSASARHASGRSCWACSPPRAWRCSPRRCRRCWHARADQRKRAPAGALFRGEGAALSGSAAWTAGAGTPRTATPA